MSKKLNNQPVATIKFGRVRANVWENTSDDGKYYHTVSFDRFYRDKNGNPKNSNSFSVSDLLLLSKVADQAHTSICQQLVSVAAATTTDEAVN